MNYEYVQLKGFAKFTHFTPMLFVLIVPVMGVALPVIQPGGKDISLLWIIGTPIAALVYWWLKRLLRYQVIHTTRNAEENYRAVLALVTELGWNIKNDRPLEFIQASVKGFPKTMSSWGELVSVAFHGNDVYINSICDPGKQPSLTAYGRNIENVEAVINAIDGPNP